MECHQRSEPGSSTVESLRLIDCRLCPRLVEWRERVGREKRAAFRDEVYWARPVPAFGDPKARLIIVGLAPAAHGGNRTGRIFTGDRSGDWLFRALHHTGFANQPTSVDRHDGLQLQDCLITAVARCAPPDNRPTAVEIETCRRWLLPDFAASPHVVVALGGIAFGQIKQLAPILGWGLTRQKFAHGAEAKLEPGPWLIASYHPSQQNTFTGRLTKEMLDGVFSRARELLG
ncbi:MAG: uracil-DNA glycosylase [Acidimicrobiia bacterium]